MARSPELPLLAKRLRQLMAKPAAWGRELDVSQQRLHNYLHGRAPNADFLRRICERKYVNVNWLLTGEGQPYLEAVEDRTSRIDETPAQYEAEAELSALSFALARSSRLRRAVAALLQQGKEGEEAIAAMGRLSRGQLARLAQFLGSLR